MAITGDIYNRPMWDLRGVNQSIAGLQGNLQQQEALKQQALRDAQSGKLQQARIDLATAEGQRSQERLKREREDQIAKDAMLANKGKFALSSQEVEPTYTIDAMGNRTLTPTGAKQLTELSTQQEGQRGEAISGINREYSGKIEQDLVNLEKLKGPYRQLEAQKQQDTPAGQRLRHQIEIEEGKISLNRNDQALAIKNATEQFNKTADATLDAKLKTLLTSPPSVKNLSEGEYVAKLDKQLQNWDKKHPNASDAERRGVLALRGGAIDAFKTKVAAEQAAQTGIGAYAAKEKLKGDISTKNAAALAKFKSELTPSTIKPKDLAEARNLVNKYKDSPSFAFGFGLSDQEELDYGKAQEILRIAGELPPTT